MIVHETQNVVAIATTGSVNRKTGPGIQIWILDSRMHPSDSRKTGADAKNQCRGCPLASYSGCYVMDMPLTSIWHRYRAGRYGKLHTESDFRSYFSDQYVRFGAYGNPSMIPLKILERIARHAKRSTGYFHDWHLMRPARAQAYGRFLMASAHPTGPASYRAAKAIGLRAFTTGGGADDAFGIECLADTAGMTCSECGLCDGTQRRNGTLPDVWIKPHGYQTQKATSV